MTADLMVDGQELSWNWGHGDFGAWLQRVLPRNFIHAELRGSFTTEYGVDLTSRRGGHTIDLTRAKIVGKKCPAVLDFTDSVGIRVFGGVIEGDADEPPAVGVLFSRCPTGDYRSAGKHRLHNITVVGSFGIAAHANLGAETVYYDHPRFESRSSPAVIFAHRNQYDLSSLWKTVDNQSTATVASVHAMQAQSQDPNRPCVIVDGFDRIHFSGLTSVSAAHACVLVDCSTNAVVGPVIDDLYARPKTQLPWAALVYRGRNGIVSHYVRASQALPSVAPMKVLIVEGEVSFLHCEWVHHETTPEVWGNAFFSGIAPSRIWRRGSEEWRP